MLSSYLIVWDRNLVRSLFFVQKDFHHFTGCFGYGGSGTEDGRYACFVQEIVVLCRDDTARDDHDVLASQPLQLFDDLRDEGLVSGCQRTYAHDVHVVLYGLACSFGRCLEQRSHVDIETAVGITRGTNLGSTVVPVLPHFGNHDTRPAAFLPGELFRQLACFGEVGVCFAF